MQKPVLICAVILLLQLTNADPHRRVSPPIPPWQRRHPKHIHRDVTVNHPFGTTCSGSLTYTGVPVATTVTVEGSTVSMSPGPALASFSAPPNSSAAYGITYSPYLANGACKDPAQVKSDFDQFTGFAIVRIYTVECNLVSTAISAAKAKGIKVFLGIYDIDKLADEIQTLISAAKDDWDLVDTVSIGNEVETPVNAIVAAVGNARSALRVAGYKGPVVTVHTFITLITYPELCQASDYVAANCHAFLAGVPASDAGSYVAKEAADVSIACGGKRVVVTETGWPHAGVINHQAVPSEENQQIAITSLKRAFSSDPSGIILFTAFDELWKKDSPDTFGAEKFYGILRPLAE